jgi:hypothetical protein
VEISQIAGSNKDPVATVEEEKQLRGAGAINAVQPVKKDAGSGGPPQQQNAEPSFSHLREEPLQLLLRAITARLNEYVPVITTPSPVVLSVPQALTPAVTAARIVAMVAMAFERFRMQQNAPEAHLLETYRGHVDVALEDGLREAKQVLTNLNLLDAQLAQQLDRTLELARATLGRTLHE